MDKSPGHPRPFLPVKLTRPGLQKTYLRPRLFNILSKVHSQSALWISGPAGSGKTTLVNSFLDTEGIDCIWYGVDQTDLDIASFFYYMGKAWEASFPEASASLPLLTQEFLREISIFTKRFFHLFLEPVSFPFAIVLDNYEATGEGARLHEILRDAIDITAGKITLIVCSRTRPPAAFARSMANRRLQILGWDQLRFQEKETQGAIHCLTASQFPKTVVSDLHRKTDGWIAGLLLLLIRKGGHDTLEPHLLTHQTPDEIFDYLGNTIFDALDPEVQAILLKLSHLSGISLNAAKILAGDHAGDILKKMNRHNSFTYVNMSDPPEYYFHPLFQEFLQKKARQFFSLNAFDALLLKSAALLEKEGKSEDAIHLYIRSGHFTGAVNLILSQAPALVSQGRIQTLEMWINQIPRQMTSEIPWLIFWQGICKIPTTPEQAKDLFRKALDLFEARSEAAGCFMALSGILDAITFQFNVFQEMDAYFEKCRQLEARFGIHGPPEMVLRLTASMLNALVLRSPDSEDTKKWSDRGWEILHMTEDITLTLQIFSPMIMLRIMQGDLYGAGHLLEVFQNVTHRKTAPLPYLVFQNLKCFHAWLCSDFQKGLTAAKQGMALEKETGISLLFLALRAHGAAAAMGLGRYDTAKKFLAEVAPRLSRQERWNQCLYHFVFSWLHLVTENWVECRYHALTFFEKATQTGNGLILAFGHLVLAKVQFALDDTQTAQSHLRQSFRLCSQYRTLQNKFMALLTRAYFLLDKGLDARVDTPLRKALHLGRKWNFRYGFLWVPREMARLCAYALKKDIEPAYVCTLIKTHHLLPDDPPVDIPNWPWPIRIRSLGGFNVRLEENDLRFSRKIQQKPLTILKYLLAHGGRNVPEYAVLDALWPDSDGDAAHNAYTTTLHRLRKLLGSSDAVIHAQGRLSLNRFLVWTDTLAFDACCNRINETLTPQACLRDTLDLSGELFQSYPGPFIPEDQVAWVIPERERLRSKFLDAVQKITDHLEYLACGSEAILCCRQALQRDPLLEPVYLRLMQVYARMGKKSEALGIYRQCAAKLQTERGDSPSRKMIALKQSLQ
ncbi:MAG TPA: BTAD domain-containing putative transcriptional regulator [Desulfotignum sp.]|nr:BTAD domain-containing putative transcriptional regulator [Desulfotignum sp.]